VQNSPPPAGLRARVMNAGVWIVAGFGVDAVLRLVTSLVMTRLLVPESFGLMAVAISIPSGLALLSDIGVRSNIIGNREVLGNELLRTAWTIQAIHGFALWIAIMLLSGLLFLLQTKHLLPAGSALAHPLLPPVLALTGAIPAIGGLNSVNLYVQQRAIYFGPAALRTLLSKIAALPVMFLWAYLDRSVWALVAGAIVSQAVLAILSHVLVPGTAMRFAWDRSKAAAIVGGGKWIALSSAGGFIASRGDRLVLAAILTGEQLGLYAIAWMLAEVARSLFNALHGQVTLPVLSEVLRTRPSAIKDVYYKYRRLIDLLCFGLAAFFWIAGQAIVELLYDDRYREAGWILQALGLSLASVPFRMIDQALIANNEWSKFSFHSASMSVSFVAAVVFGQAFFGWTGAIWAVALYAWPPTALILMRAYRRGWIDPIREISMVPTAALGLAAGYAFVWLEPALSAWVR
jgi:O-antigen/teichoic acid export membrane protein